MIFDSHAHLLDLAFDRDREALLSRLPGEGVCAVTEIGFDLESSRRAAEFSEKQLSLRRGPEGGSGAEAGPEIYAAVGLHPDYAADCSDEVVRELSELSLRKGVAAIGEVGLDYYHLDKRSPCQREEAVRAKGEFLRLQRELLLRREEKEQLLREKEPGEEELLSFVPGGEELSALSLSKKSYRALRELSESVDFSYAPEPEIQKSCYLRMIELALFRGLPIVIHSRESARDSYELLRDSGGYKNSGIVHCFSYPLEVARQFAELGMYLGIGGVLTFPNAKKLRRLVAELPLSMMVLETDSPYLSPLPHRGERNNPAHLRYVVRALSEIKGIREEEVIRITAENARAVYRI